MASVPTGHGTKHTNGTNHTKCTKSINQKQIAILKASKFEASAKLGN